MSYPILVTGSRGLIGRRMVHRLRSLGQTVREFDVADDASNDLRDLRAVTAAMDGVVGVIHLGGVSRVVWGQRDPANCRITNTIATEAILVNCRAQKRSPWMIYASSREVYGLPVKFPTDENAELRPMNVYAESKRDSEAHCRQAADAGQIANIVRFSSVYGSPEDHPDRVAPAFARAAAFGGEIKLEGAEHTLDFTHIDDVTDGLERLVKETSSGKQLPPIHFVSGRGVKLGDLAELARRSNDRNVSIRQASPRDYDVSRFIGNPERAFQLLGWRATTSIDVGFDRLIRDLRQLGDRANVRTTGD